MDTKNIQEGIQSKKFRNSILVLGIFVAALLLFWAGMRVGYMRAGFNYRFGESYYRTYEPGDDHRAMGFIPNEVGNAHGVNGKIINIQLPTIVVADIDNTEKIIHISDDSLLRKFRDTIYSKDLRVGDFIIVLGEPGEKAAIEAKFIRVVPPPNSAPVTTTPLP